MHIPGVVLPAYTQTHAHDASPKLATAEKAYPFPPRRWGASFGPDFARGASGKRPLCNLISLPSQHFTPIDTDSAALSLVTAFQARHSPSPLHPSKDAFLPTNIQHRLDSARTFSTSCIECQSQLFFQTRFSPRVLDDKLRKMIRLL